VLVTAGFVSLAWNVPRLAGLTDAAVFYAIAGVTVGSAVAAMTCRSPVYSAIWFALVLLGTAGLFLFDGAQFLAMATVIVYAGAILVTFLFVLMLANPGGHASYDRISWEPILSAAAGAILIWMLTGTVAAALEPSGTSSDSGPAAPTLVSPASDVDREAGVLRDDHLAMLGGRLFSTYLVAVEVAGTLLLVALVGAVAIVAHGRATPPVAQGAGHE